MRTTAAGLILALAMALTGCGGGDVPEEDAVAVPSPAAPSAAAPAAPADDCTEAPAALVKAVQTHLDGFTLDDTFVVRGESLVYLGANVVRPDGQRESSADVWVATNEAGADLAALSGSARNDLTPNLPDATDPPYSVSAGDEFGMAVQQCVITASRGG